jgi:hypothetical protein
MKVLSGDGLDRHEEIVRVLADAAQADAASARRISAAWDSGVPWCELARVHLHGDTSRMRRSRDAGPECVNLATMAIGGQDRAALNQIFCVYVAGWITDESRGRSEGPQGDLGTEREREVSELLPEERGSRLAAVAN